MIQDIVLIAISFCLFFSLVLNLILWLLLQMLVTHIQELFESYQKEHPQYEKLSLRRD